jgi:hypothetical protein
VRAFDWPKLLQQQGIPYIERGANVKRGEINIRCPFCGSADPSFHLGLNLETGWYSCWRNRAGHSGKSPLRLLMRLLHCSYQKARELAGLGDDYVDPEGFTAAAARIMGRDKIEGRPEQIKREFLQFDRHFVRIDEDRVATRRAWNYLYQRGFEAEDVDRLVDLYQLKTARDGHYAARVILPYIENGKLVAWTGRAIGDAVIRYKDLPRDLCIVPPKETLFNFDATLEGGKVLVIVEGPFDALKLDFYGREFGVRAVALSTNSITTQQVNLIHEIADRFPAIMMMMDNASSAGVVDSMRMKQELAGLDGLQSARVPFKRKDAGELSRREVREWCLSITRT